MMPPNQIVHPKNR